MNSSAHFYDAEALLSFNVNDRNKIDLFGYLSNDRFGFAGTTDYKYTNLLGSLDGNIHSAISFFQSDSRYKRLSIQVSESDTSRLWKLTELIPDCFIKIRSGIFSWLPNGNHSIDFGINAALYNIQAG